MLNTLKRQNGVVNEMQRDRAMSILNMYLQDMCYEKCFKNYTPFHIQVTHCKGSIQKFPLSINLVYFTFEDYHLYNKVDTHPIQITTLNGPLYLSGVWLGMNPNRSLNGSWFIHFDNWHAFLRSIKNLRRNWLRAPFGFANRLTWVTWFMSYDKWVHHRKLFV